MKKLVLGMTVFAVGAAMANTTYYLRNDCSESSSYKESVKTASAWNTKTDATGVNATVIDSTGDFVVELWRWLRLQYYLGETFTGNSLTIERGYLFWYDTCNTFDADGQVIFKTGGFRVARKSNNSRSSFNADVLFKQPADLPFGVFPGNAVINSWIYFNKKFASDSDVTAHIGYGRPTSGYDATATGFRALLCGDYSDFVGTLVVTTANETVTYPAYATSLSLGDSAKGFPGTIRVTDRCALETLSAENTQKTAGIVKIANLVLGGGSMIALGSATEGFEATESLTVEGPVHVRLLYEQVKTDDLVRIPVLKAPAAGLLKLDDFALDFGLTSAYDAETAGLELSKDGRTLYVVFYQQVSLDTSDPGDFTKPGLSSALSPANKGQWSDTAEPHEFAVYTVGYPKQLRTLNDFENDYVFPRKRLVLALGGSLFLQGKSFKGDVELAGSWGNLRAVSNYGKLYVLDGTLTLSSGSILHLMTQNSGTLEIASSICGTGGLQIEGNGSTSVPQATTALSGDNSAWLGKISVTQASGTSGGKAFPSLERFQWLSISSSAALGGKLTTFAADALLLQDYSKLYVTETLTLPSDLNRGLTISGFGQIGVEAEKTLTVNWPIALNGTLWKNNDGMLVLGGTTTAGDNAALTVAAGCVKAASCGCLDGATIYTASESTPLVLDFNPADADLKRYGIRNVKTDAPFMDGRKVYLRLDGVDDAVIAAARRTDAGFKQGLVTVKTSALDTFDVKANLVFTKPEKTRLIREDDAATGWTTFSLYGRDSGFSVIVR